jgi:hypothetical protein
MTRRTKACALALAVACTSACDPEPETQLEELGFTCEGKCDGLGTVKNLLRNPKDLDLDDLIQASVPFVVEQVNDFLSSSSFVDIKLAEPAFHGEADIEHLVTGLAARFGERELSTQVNRVRAEHLAASDDTTYAEVAVKIDTRIAQNWGFDTAGLGDLGVVTSWVGFDAGSTLEARVIGAHPFEPGDPLNNLRALRGFILPRSLDELRAMKPGELLALRGRGRLGINLGVGVPVLVAEPTSVVTYSVVLSAGLRSYLDGVLYSQLVRLDGGELVVDVGIERARVRSARLALEDRWGVQGLLELDLEIGGRQIDLGKLVDRALSRQLNKKLDLVAAHAERSSTSTRTSVARFRIDLDEADPDLLEPMLRQALLGDVRLAQALANRDEPGISAEFDFLRSGLSTTSSAGIDIFGLSFLRRTIESEGTIVVQTPGGARSLMFDSLRRERGAFVSKRGYTRVGLAGLVWDPDGENPRTESNLFLQVAESDKGMERDKYVDHLDALIVAVAGPEVYAVVDEPANELERFVQSLCPDADISDPCTWHSTQEPELRSRMDAALAEFSGAITHLDEPVQELLMTVAGHKLLAQGTYEVKNNGFIGPGTELFVDFRLDDATLAELALHRKGADLVSALGPLLAATEVRRDRSASNVAADRRQILQDAPQRLRGMATAFDAFAANYERLLQAENASLDTIGTLGPRTLELRFEVDQSQRPILESAIVQSLAQARAKVAADLFDTLEREARGWAADREQVAAYGLLALVSREHLDLRLDIDHFLEDTFAARRRVYRDAGYPEQVSAYARGPRTQRIDGGLFDIDALIRAE